MGEVAGENCPNPRTGMAIEGNVRIPSEGINGPGRAWPSFPSDVGNPRKTRLHLFPREVGGRSLEGGPFSDRSLKCSLKASGVCGTLEQCSNEL